MKRIATTILVVGMLFSLLVVGVVGASTPTLISCDADGNERNQFAAGESIYIKGTNFPANNYRVWIQNQTLNEGDILDVGLDPSGATEYVYVDSSGNLEKDGKTIIKIWEVDENALPTFRAFTIVVDEVGNGNEGFYSSTYDITDGTTSVAGFIAAVPEISAGVLFSVGLLGLVGYVGLKRRND